MIIILMSNQFMIKKSVSLRYIPFESTSLDIFLLNLHMSLITKFLLKSTGRHLLPTGLLECFKCTLLVISLTWQSYIRVLVTYLQYFRIDDIFFIVFSNFPFKNNEFTDVTK